MFEVAYSLLRILFFATVGYIIYFGGRYLLGYEDEYIKDLLDSKLPLKKRIKGPVIMLLLGFAVAVIVGIVTGKLGPGKPPWP